MSEINVSKRKLRPAQLAAKLGVSVPTVWRYARNNPAFPRPIKLSERVTFFDEHQVDQYLDSLRTVA